ncbi:hypothetical protein [Microcystis phage MinS1]|nr:hypothetical protein [Microcystis phage MinS1]
MTQHDARIPACHYDATLEARVTRRHADGCPDHPDAPHNLDHCPGRDGCQPCDHPHCVICRREHLTPSDPTTCPECLGKIRRDLEEILWSCRHLRWQATRAARNGRLAAAAPIPGGDALVIYARAGADLPDLTWSKHLDDDHHAQDPIPVMLPLATWDTQWRRHFGHPTPAAPSVAGIVRYLIDHLTDMARTTDGPDWVGFTTGVAALRRQLDAVLHDEQDPERGVPCFECGDRLERQFADPQRCRHQTPARQRLDAEETRAAAGRATLTALATYPELRGREYPRGYTPLEQAAARPPTSAQVSAAAAPCERCASSRGGQGGIVDPTVGQSWECTGCRKTYTAGEYANAVRSHLLTSGPGGDGWTHIGMAAEAATTMTQLPITPLAVRRWMDRGQVVAICRWSPGVTWGQRLVYWPSVSEQATRVVERAERAAADRRRYLEQATSLRIAVRAGEDVDTAGKRLGIHPARVEKITAEWAVEAMDETA